MSAILQAEAAEVAGYLLTGHSICGVAGGSEYGKYV